MDDNKIDLVQKLFIFQSRKYFHLYQMKNFREDLHRHKSEKSTESNFSIYCDATIYDIFKRLLGYGLLSIHQTNCLKILRY